MFSSKGNKGFAFVIFIASRYARRTPEGPALAAGPSGGGPLAEEHKPQLIPASRQNMHPTASRGLCSASRNMRKSSENFFGLLGSLANSDRNAHTALSRHHTPKESTAPSRTITDSRIPCRPSDTSNNLFGLCQYNMAAARTIFAFIARAACHF